MGLYKYTSNKDPQDGTEEIRLPGREPVSMGGEIDLSDEEYDSLKSRLNLRKVESSDSKADEEQGDESTQDESKSAK